MISAFKKINIIAPKLYQKQILNYLQDFGQAEIRSIKNRQQKELIVKIDNINLKLKDIEFVLNFLKDYQTKPKKTLWQRLAPAKKEYSLSKMRAQYRNLNLEQIILETEQAEESLNQGASQLVYSEKEKQELMPWKSLSRAPKETKFVKTIFGKALLNNYLELLQELEKNIKNIVFETCFQDLKYVYLTIAYDKTKDISQILNKYKFEKQEFTIENPKKTFRNLKLEIRNLRNALRQKKLELQKLSQEISSLEIAYDWLCFKKQRLEAQKSITATRYFSIISIWLPKRYFNKLQKQMHEISQEIILQKEKIFKTDQPPVVIENNNLIRPFETVTNIYGLPKYKEIDPTLFLAPFFILFFALCLTDAGYGLVMALLCFAAIKIMKIPRENQKLFRLLIYAGFLTFVVGAFFGGWFGIDLNNLPESSVKNFLLKIRLINPMTDTLLFMGLTFVLGFIQIWFSQIVKLYYALKIKAKDLIWQASSWLIFLTSLPIAGLTKNIWLAIACFSGVVMLGDQRIKIFARPFIGTISALQTMIGFMSDILSYSRLMALGLATGIIGFIINIIAGIFKDMIPVFGWGIWILVLISGHLFNIGINALGGFIHSARLQFVEFFPKFLEGGGKKFKPFTYHAKFVNIKNN